MALVSKQDSNTTELRFAVEVSPAVVDGTVSWLALEPNSYKNFGGEVKTKQRMPINASRQLKKGVVVDEDAAGGFVQDLTAINSQEILQTFMYAVLRRKSEVTVAIVDGTGNAFQPASGGDTYLAGDLLFAKDFASTANDGLKTVTGFPTAANVAVTDTGLQDATGNTGVISRVGYQFGSAEATIDISGPFPKFKLAATPVKASGTLTTTGTFTDAETITIGGKVYTLQSVLTNVDGHVKIAGTTALTLDNLKNAINGSGGVPGTDYAAANVANARVTATDTPTTLVVTAKAAGTVGNAITTTETCTNASWGGGTLAGGTGGRGLDSFGIIPGEFVFIGGDSAGTSFATANDNGFCRVRNIAVDYLELDKTQHIMAADTGTGKTIQLFFGRVLKNESDPSLIVKRSVQLERTLGAPDDSLPSQIQSEYLIRALGNTCKIDMKTADIITLELDFIANTRETRTGAQGLKTGSRPVLSETDAFNSTSDVAFTKMAVVTDANSCPSPLFAYFTDLTIDVKNNVKQNKAVSVLGAFDSTPGFFQVQSQVTAYFTDVSEIEVVKANSSVTVETHLVKFNKGVTIDLPLVVLSKAQAEIKINEPITIPLENDASTAKTISTNLDHTMLWVFWDYLPNLAG